MVYSSIVNGIDAAKDVVVLVLAASRVGEDDERLPITDGQKDAAMNAAKATLQCVGAEVLESSSALLIPALEGRARLAIDCSIEEIE